MAMFVHLAKASDVPHIRRVGIRRQRRRSGDFPGGVFAVPLTNDFQISHQWLRELKRWKHGPIAAVYLRIADDEPVWVGHYHRQHRWLTAAEAVAGFMKGDDVLGWEVVIPRRVSASEIHRTARLPQVIGWRYFPGSKGQRPFVCACCTRGEYGARRLRQRAERDAIAPG